jgi:hypothetical protein
MFALRERRIHVTQEDFEMAVGKVMRKDGEKDMSILKLVRGGGGSSTRTRRGFRGSPHLKNRWATLW